MTRGPRPVAADLIGLSGARVDAGAGRARPAGAGAYLGDPALAAILAATGGPTASDSRLVENVIAVALLRAAEPDALERFSDPDHIFYWRSTDGREIDFLVTEPSLPIESKYGARPTGKDYESITKAFGRGIMVSRRDVDLERPVLTVSAGVLLALIG